MKMLITYLITLLIIKLLIPTSHADACFANCTNAQTYTPNSPYQINLSNLLNTLISKSSLTGFYNTSTGQTPNQVYGLYLCRGDLGSTECSACVSQAQQTILEECPSRVQAMIWFDKCMLGFSNKQFTNYAPSRVVYNPKIIPINETLVFNKTLNPTMNGLAHNVVNSSIKYGTKVANLTKLDRLYTLEQCAPNLSAKECAKCLKIAIAQLPSMYGARVLLPTCNIRFEFSQFYTDAVNVSFFLPGTPTPSRAMSPAAATTTTAAAASLGTPPSTASKLSPHLNGFW
ncbi:hypothetical protein KSS87_007343, partial [Heliosperma pusillum]